MRAAGAILAGGHTIRDAEPKYGLAVVGTEGHEGMTTIGIVLMIVAIVVGAGIGLWRALFVFGILLLYPLVARRWRWPWMWMAAGLLLTMVGNGLLYLAITGRFDAWLASIFRPSKIKTPTQHAE